MSINPHMEILKSLNYMFRIHCKVVRKARVASEGNKMFWELALFYGKSCNPSAAPATQSGDGGLQSAAPSTITATHLVKTTQKYCACHTKRLSTRCQTGWNVTKCHTCNAKRHHNLLGNLRKGEVSASPLDTARPQENQRLEMRRVGASKRAFRARLPPIFIICSFKIDVFLRLQICYLKIDVSCKASVNFHHISQSATPATEFAPCRHLTQPWECDSQKTRSATRLKSCACHAKWRWTRLKCCACHENCNGSSENVAKVLRLPHKATFDTLQNTSECHEMPHLPRETKQRDVWNLQKWPSLQNLP